MELVLITGLAGAGKSTLTGSLVRWFEGEGVDARAVNLDPGAESLPYDPAYDVRTMVRVRDLMERGGLGPNGAMIAAVSTMAERGDEIASSLPECEVCVVDTPGQTELFALRREGADIVRALSERGEIAGVFMAEASEPGVLDFVTVGLIGRLVELRLGIPIVPVLNKVDLGWRESGRLWERVVTGGEVEVGEGGAVSELLEDLVEAIRSFSTPVRVVQTSALRGEGIDDLVSTLREVWCACGDLT